MQNAQINNNQQTCETCKCYLGLHPPDPQDDNAPFAWCDPYLKNRRVPCMPWADASNKACYYPKK